jgi:phosphatidylglycerophosphate synthase
MALGVELAIAAAVPLSDEPVVLASADVFATAQDVRAVIERRGRLVRRDGTPIDLGWAPPSADIAGALAGAVPVGGSALAARIDSDAAARRAERELWRSLASDGDGIVDRYLNRPLGRTLSKVLVHTSASPNHVTAAATAMGLASAYLFSRGVPSTDVWAAVLLQASAVVDCVDGELARATYQESRFGRWFDLVADQAVHVVVFLSIAGGAARSGSIAAPWLLGASAAAGAVIAFLTVLWSLRSPSRPSGRLSRLVDAATSRDYSIVIVVLALLGRTSWFLWAAAIGVHVFWIAALAARRLGSAESARDAAGAQHASREVGG